MLAFVGVVEAMKRLAAVALAALAWGVSWGATFTSTGTYYYTGPNATTSFAGAYGPTPQDVCASAAERYNAYLVGTLGEQPKAVSYDGGGSCRNTSGQVIATVSAVTTCPAGKEVDKLTGACTDPVPPEQTACAPGNDRGTKLIRMGYARAAANPSGSAYLTSDGRPLLTATPDLAAMFRDGKSGALPGGSSTMCDGTCTVSASGAAGDWWNAKTPDANGMVGIYREFNLVATGTACASVNDAMKPDTPGQCDGQLGQVNGKTVCLTKDTPSVNPMGNNVKQTSSAAGATKSTATTNADGSKLGPNGEWPGTNGDKASLPDLSGTGTNTTPTPSTSTTTTKDANGNVTGTSTTTIDVQVCGVPGKPACKIDESGTPDKLNLKSEWDNVATPLEQTMQSRRETIGGTADKSNFFGNAWTTMWNAPPVSECSAITMPQVMNIQIPDLNPCGVVPGARLVFAFLWSFVGLWSCVGMVREVI